MPFDPVVQHLVHLGLHRALSTDTVKPNDLLVVVAEGIVGEMVSTSLPGAVVGVTDTGTIAALFVGEARAAILRAVPTVQIAIEHLDGDWIPVVTIDNNNLLTMSACRLVWRGGGDRLWSN